jgi:hypothetical protein
VTLPKPAHPGDAFALEPAGEGQWILSRLEKPAAKVKLLSSLGSRHTRCPKGTGVTQSAEFRSASNQLSVSRLKSCSLFTRSNTA